MEIWKNIKGYEGLYKVSNLGNVKSLDKKDSIGRKVTGRIMKPTKRKDGYLEVTLHKGGKGKHYLIHRLVAETFVLNQGNYKEINHIDENKTNNKTSNLEWCNRSYNINYGVANKNRRKALLNKRGKEITQYDKNWNKIKTFPSLMQVVRELGLSKSDLSQCCNEKRKTAGGFQWKYTSE